MKVCDRKDCNGKGAGKVSMGGARLGSMEADLCRADYLAVEKMLNEFLGVEPPKPVAPEPKPQPKSEQDVPPPI